MNIIDIYVTFIFIIKMIYFIFNLLEFYYKNKDQKLFKIFNYLKNYFEFLFILLMSLLLILIFNPFFDNINLIDKEVKILLFIYAIIIIIYSKSENHFEFLFISLFSLLLILIFNPFFDNTKLINNEVKIIIFLYAIIILINSILNTF
jgi:hypothetical protein